MQSNCVASPQYLNFNSVFRKGILAYVLTDLNSRNRLVAIADVFLLEVGKETLGLSKLPHLMQTLTRVLSDP